MSTFFMFGKYSSDAVKYISSDRTKDVRKLVEGLGGKVQSMYALLGEYDLVFIVQFPNMTDAMKSAVALERLTGISFSTAAAVTVEEFDQLIGNL